MVRSPCSNPFNDPQPAPQLCFFTMQPRAASRSSAGPPTAMAQLERLYRDWRGFLQGSMGCQRASVRFKVEGWEGLALKCCELCCWVQQWMLYIYVLYIYQQWMLRLRSRASDDCRNPQTSKLLAAPSHRTVFHRKLWIQGSGFRVQCCTRHLDYDFCLH